MQLRLPDRLPSAGVLAELRFRRMPREPCVLRVCSPRAGPITQFDMYGRGERSKAAQSVVLNVRLDTTTIAEHQLRAGDTLQLVTETLDGVPQSSASPGLELVGVTFRPLEEV